MELACRLMCQFREYQKPSNFTMQNRNLAVFEAYICYADYLGTSGHLKSPEQLILAAVDGVLMPLLVTKAVPAICACICCILTTFVAC